MMKKLKGVAVAPPPMESSPFAVYEDPRASFKHQSLLQDYEELKKEAEAKREKLEMLRQKKLTLMAEVRFLRRRYKQLKQNQPLKPERGRIFGQPLNSVTCKKNTSKERNYHGREAGLPPPVPRLDLNRKGKIYNGKETSLQNPSLTFDLNKKQRTSKETVLQSSFPVIDLNQKERVYSGKEATTHSMTPVFDLNQISREVEEELQANSEPTRLEDLKKSSIRGGSDEQLNDMKLSVCRNVGNGPNQAGKRKISWQDQVALRV